MNTPPFLCTTSTVAFKNPTGSGYIPSDENIESARKQENLYPASFNSSIVFCISDAYHAVNSSGVPP